MLSCIIVLCGLHETNQMMLYPAHLLSTGCCRYDGYALVDLVSIRADNFSIT